MNDRASARHRASLRAATPLSALTASVSDGVGTLSRGGVVVAMSSGLVATMGLPAQGVTSAGPASAAATAEAAVPASLAAPAAGLTISGAFQAVPSTLSVGAPVTAPATAAVSFDSSGFTAKAAPKPSAGARSAGATSRSGARATLTGSARGSTIIAIAARYVGTPYRYGGTTPAGFDCSGFVRYVFAQVGVSLPRTANEQMNATRRVSRSEARPGDLVFFVSGGRAYHNGIYAGGSMMYDSPRSGKTLQKREIWSSSVVFTRVG